MQIILNKSHPSKKEIIYSCNILNSWCLLDNYIVMVSRQCVRTLLVISLVGSPFLPQSAWAWCILQRGKRTELAAFLLKRGSFGLKTYGSPY